MRQRIESLEQFRALQADYMAARDAEKRKILVCCGTGCVAGGNLNVYHELKKRMDELGIPCEVSLTEHHADTIGLKKSGCHGFCEMGPLVHIEPMGVMYIHVKPEDCHEILEKTVLGGEVIDRLVYHLDGTAYPKQEDIPFYKKQHRVVLENCGTSDAEDIEEYIAKGGYSAFEKALFEMTDEQICRNILDSGLRGRGGGGFPAGRKWDGARKQKSAKKYIVCNGDEGDPGAFMDRSVMEGNPHSVLEGMMIAGLAVGSDEGYIYVRAEYPLAVNRLKTAIARAEEMGLLGTNILGSDFNFRIHVNKGAGAFVCGEGSALTASIEGNRGMPRVKPPRTIEHGLWAEPTVLNNVETYARRKVKSVRRLNKVYTEVTFTEPLPDGVEPMHVVAADDEYPEVLIEGCRMRGNRARGLLLGSRNRMVIEDNYFHIAGAAILIEGDANYWYEQSGVRDVVIRRNLFENGNYGSPGWGSACIAVGSGIPDRETSRYHRNIRVEGNTFRVFDPRIVNLYCVDGFVFTRDNVIEYTDDYPYVLDEKRNFITRNCDRVVVDKKQTDKK